MIVDDLLAEARSVLPHRPGPAEAIAAQAKGALLVDNRAMTSAGPAGAGDLCGRPYSGNIQNWPERAVVLGPCICSMTRGESACGPLRGPA